jgi:hypothetical protein
LGRTVKATRIWSQANVVTFSSSHQSGLEYKTRMSGQNDHRYAIYITSRHSVHALTTPDAAFNGINPHIFM